MTVAQKIKAEIKRVGGLSTFSAAAKKERPAGCPELKSMKTSITTDLTREEIYIAFRLGLIGNNGHKGTIVENSKA